MRGRLSAAPTRLHVNDGRRCGAGGRRVVRGRAPQGCAEPPSTRLTPYEEQRASPDTSERRQAPRRVAADEVVVDQPDRLHQGVHRGRPDEGEPGLLQGLGQCQRLGCLGTRSSVSAGGVHDSGGAARSAPPARRASRSATVARALVIGGVAPSSGCGRCPRRPSAARRRRRRTPRSGRRRSRGRPPGTPGASSGSSARTARTGTPPGSAARGTPPRRATGRPHSSSW